MLILGQKVAILIGKKKAGKEKISTLFSGKTEIAAFFGIFLYSMDLCISHI